MGRGAFLSRVYLSACLERFFARSWLLVWTTTDGWDQRGRQTHDDCQFRSPVFACEGNAASDFVFLYSLMSAGSQTRSQTPRRHTAPISYVADARVFLESSGPMIPLSLGSFKETHSFRFNFCDACVPGLCVGAALNVQISSTSTCTDYQARRLNIRHNNSLTSMANAAVYSVSAEQQQKEQAQKPPGWFAQYQSPSAQARANPFVHTLNGTACAIPRTMIALIEQGMQENRRVRIPEVLRPFMMGQAELPFTGPHRLP